MHTTKLILICLIILQFCCNFIYAQDIEQIVDNKPIVIKGGLNANATYYYTNGSESQRDPFMWVLNGNFNLSFFGVVNAPFSFILSPENKSFNQPSYQKVGISPQYKSVTLHLGYRNLNFSKYTLSGITFLGAGFEYSPVKSLFKIKGFYGRFARAEQYIPLSVFDEGQIYVPPSYERWGYGTMLTVGKKDHLVDIIVFKAEDQSQSINVPDSIELFPEENFVLGLNTHNKLFDILSLDINYAISAYSSDIRQDEVHQDTYSYANNLGFLFTPRTSSKFNNVLDVGLNLSPGKFNLGVNFLRIDSEYASMGTAFINNDRQELTGNISTNLFKNKVSLAGSIGLQHNNLDKTKIVTNKRLISSFNFSWLINQQLSVTANLSNFNANVTPVRVYMVDSIKYSQLTQNAGINAMYNFGDSIFQHGITAIASYQYGNTLNQTGTEVTDITNTFINTNVSYRLGYMPLDISFVLSVNYSSFASLDVVTNSIGPSIGINKQFLKRKLNTGLTATYLNSFGENTDSQVYNIRFYSSYNVTKHHKFTLGMNVLSRKSSLSKAFHYQANVAYSFLF